MNNSERILEIRETAKARPLAARAFGVHELINEVDRLHGVLRQVIVCDTVQAKDFVAKRGLKH